MIKASDRKKRNLFLTLGDEIKLLRACKTEDRRHLRALKMTPRVREALLDVINNPPAKAFKVQRGKKPSADLVGNIQQSPAPHGPEH